VATHEELSDDDLAFLRRVRFGELPRPARPEDYVELREFQGPPEPPDDGFLRPPEPYR
jgi:hypothetical protein